MSTLAAEDLLLLLLDDRKGTTPAGTAVDTVLGGAVLLELALIGAVSVEKNSGGRWRKPTVHVIDAGRVIDPVLVGAMRTVAEKERTAQNLVGKLGKGLKSVLADRLVTRGILEPHETDILGLIKQTRWTALDSGHKNELRKTITAVLVRQDPPDERAGALIALLSAVDRAHKTVESSDIPGREIKRAKQVAKGAWAAEAVRDAVTAAATAVTTATIAAVAATSDGGG